MVLIFKTSFWNQRIASFISNMIFLNQVSGFFALSSTIKYYVLNSHSGCFQYYNQDSYILLIGVAIPQNNYITKERNTLSTEHLSKGTCLDEKLHHSRRVILYLGMNEIWILPIIHTQIFSRYIKYFLVPFLNLEKIYTVIFGLSWLSSASFFKKLKYGIDVECLSI